MRIRVVFKLKNKGAALPFHHQKNISALLSEVHSEELVRNNELLCFSSLKGQTRVGREGLHYFSSRVTIVFTSLYRRFLYDFIEALFEREVVFLGDLILSPEFVEEELLPEVEEMQSRYLCISPIVINNTGDNLVDKAFVHPETDEFSDLIYDATMSRMERSGLYTGEEISSFYKFQLIPDKKYLQKIESRDKKFARIYTIIHQGKLREVRAYTFPFELYADSKVQNFIFACGFGELSNCGFGMLDHSNEHSLSRQLIHQRKSSSPLWQNSKEVINKEKLPLRSVKVPKSND